LGAASLSFVVGALCLVTLTLATVRHQVAWGSLVSLPPLLWLGGLLGAIYVTVAIVLTPMLGTGAVIALGIAGQVVASLALDHYGMLGLAAREITLGRASGAMLVIVGALMVRRWKRALGHSRMSALPGFWGPPAWRWLRWPRTALVIPL
jgi:transporter family-2 protein